MQADIVTHVQDAVRPGEVCDMYYSNQENSVKQAHPTTVENRYLLDLNSKNFGSANTLIFNPDEGVGHIVLNLQLQAPGGSLTYQGLALNKGWGYNCIRRLGVRIGNSTLYYFSGDQLMMDALSDCEDSVKKDVLFQLGGAPLVGGTAASTGAGDFASASNRTAYVYLKCPWNSPSAQEKMLPLPSDLLTSPIQINVEFKQANEFFLQSPVVNGGTTPVLPTVFDVAQAQWEQTHFDDRGEQLARKVNMSEMAYSYPLRYFAQEVFRLNSVPGGSLSSQTLTGLRSGNCLGIRIWCKSNDDATVLGAGASGAQSVYAVPTQLTLAVNGLIYFDSRNGQSQLWTLLDRKTPAQFSADTITVNEAGTAWATNSGTSSYWTFIPFAQHSEVLANETELTHGLSLMNSIVNLQIQLPPTGVSGGTNTYTVTAEYIFNSTVLFSRGGAEYIF